MLAIAYVMSAGLAMAQTHWDEVLKKVKLPPSNQWASEVSRTTIEPQNFQIVAHPNRKESEKTIQLIMSDRVLVEKKSIAVTQTQIRALENEGISSENISWVDGKAFLVTISILPFFKYLFCNSQTCRQKDIVSEKFVHLHESMTSRLKLDEQDSWVLSGLSFVSWAFVYARVAMIAKSALSITSISKYMIKPLTVLTGTAPLGVFILAEKGVKSSERLRNAYKHVTKSYYEQGSKQTSLDVIRPDAVSNVYKGTTGTYTLPEDVRIGDFASKLKWMLTDISVSRFKVDAVGFENHQIWATAPKSYSASCVQSLAFPGSMRLMLRMIDGWMNHDEF